jgi:hypothetical protein
MNELVGTSALIGPLLAQVGLTFLVWVYLYTKRLPFFFKAKISSEKANTPGILDTLPSKARYPSDNFKNLAEVPILFYAVCLIATVGGMVDGTLVALAWVFVAFRTIHSLIQCTYNEVMHRFLVYSISTIALMIMWGRMAFGYFLG